MNVRVNVRMPKIMRTSIKEGVRTYAKYVYCQTLDYPFLYLEQKLCRHYFLRSLI